MTSTNEEEEGERQRGVTAERRWRRAEACTVSSCSIFFCPNKNWFCF